MSQAKVTANQSNFCSLYILNTSILQIEYSVQNLLSRWESLVTGPRGGSTSHPDPLSSVMSHLGHLGQGFE